MTSALLSFGCTLIAFSPTLTLLLLFTYHKAQLVIIVTTSAFFYLLSSLTSSILNLPFSFMDGLVGSSSKWNAFLLIPISVICQSFFRCAFVKMYLKVEGVIEKSIAAHEEEEEEKKEVRRNRNRGGRRTNNSGGGRSTSNDNGHGNPTTTSNNNNNNNNNDDGDEEEADDNENQMSESSLLRLELNDVSCSISAGVGFGGMHAVLLYGTLLASEGGRKGTLYQPSCAIMPSLVNSALMAFWFSILDIVWMMVAFYGVRKWQSYNEYKEQQQQQQQSTFVATAYHGAAGMYEWSFAKGRVSGKSAILFMVVTHLIAGLTTSMNVILPANGCVIALPMLTFVAVGIACTAWVYLKDNFLPESQKQRIRLANHLD